MRPDILIVGQGLAGTFLAWECERAGISFAIADRGHATAATAAAAGIINPVTGRRLVKSWRIDALLPAARAAYRELSAALGVPLWRDLRVRRLFANERERAVWRDKQARGDLAPFVEREDHHGIWIRDAARIELGPLLAVTRQRWLHAGTLRVGSVDFTRDRAQYELVVDCTGQVGAASADWDFLPWEFSKGELLELAVDGLLPDVVLNRGHWIVPVGAGKAWVGATHEPGVRESSPTAAARTRLEGSVREILGRDWPFLVTGHRAGLRVNLPDKRPVAGRHPSVPRLGLVNGLGAKGALWAPMLARQWLNHLTEGVPFDPEIDVRRFV